MYIKQILLNYHLKIYLKLNINFFPLALVFIGLHVPNYYNFKHIKNWYFVSYFPLNSFKI